MIKYKHYSFDLWLTLIKSNPKFKEERALYFFNHFNRDKKSLDEVKDIIRDIDVMCNNINQCTGYSIDAFEMYAMILHRLNYNYTGYKFRDLHAIYHKLESLFFQYPPTLYDEDTLPTLRSIYEAGHTLSILSNTGFIRGFTIDHILIDLKIIGYFSFRMYSDEIGLSKPSAPLYSKLIEKVLTLRRHNPVFIREIVHIGDNFIADHEGAKAAGIDSIIINSKLDSETIKSVFP